MPERTEIEAVAMALVERNLRFANPVGLRARVALDLATAAIEALDRVRDARGDDEGARAMEIAGDIARDHARRFPDGEPSCSSCGVRLDQDNAAEDATCCDYCVAKAARSPQAEDHENCPDCWGGRPKWAGTMPAPPCPTCGGAGKIPWSPQREDHEALIAMLRRRSAEPGMGWLNQAADALSSRDGTVAVEDVRDWLAQHATVDTAHLLPAFESEFGPARAGESDEGDR